MKLLQWARKGGEIVHISEVERGAACRCVCDACGASLIAKKGPKNALHFAHSNSECQGNQETLLHLKAKEIIAESKRLKVRGKDDDQVVTFDEVVLEKQVGPYRVDVVGIAKGRECYIEIAVTHNCDREKIQYFRDNGLPLVELSIPPQFDASCKLGYSNFVTSEAPRRWLSNPVLKVTGGLQAMAIDYEALRELQERREKLEPVFLEQLRGAVGNRPNQLHYGELQIVDLRRFGIPYKNSLCVKSQELPKEYENLAMVSWHHKELRKYLGKRVGFDIIYDYEKSLVLTADNLFPQVVIRWVEGVDRKHLAWEIGTPGWRRKAYPWI